MQQFVVCRRFPVFMTKSHSERVPIELSQQGRQPAGRTIDQLIKPDHYKDRAHRYGLHEQYQEHEMANIV